MRRSTRLVGAVMIAGGMLVAVDADAGALGCSVTNTRTGVTYARLQRAVDAAVDGDPLEIRGICTGTTAIAAKTLRISGIPTAEHPVASLDGLGAGRVLVVTHAKLVIRDLTITGGKARFGAGVMLERHARLVMRGFASVSRNAGGGIGVSHSRVALHDSASVEGNRSVSGGGISAVGSTVTLNDSASVTGNHARSTGGGIRGDMNAAVILNDSSSVSGNRAGGRFGDGGGIWTDWASVTLNDSATVAGNSATEEGGGIFAQYYVTLSGSATATANTAGIGGGIYLYYFTLTLNDSSSVYDNTAVTAGGGIWVDEWARIVLDGSSSVTGNAAGSSGGGIYALDGYEHEGRVEICSDLVAISPNDPDDPPETFPCT